MTFIEKSELIYQGKSTLVYLGTHPDFDGNVVFKVFNNPYANSYEIVQFDEEFSILEGLDHPCIRKAYQSSVIDGKHVLCLEHFDGMSLTSFLDNKIIPIKLFFRLALQMVDAVGYIHSKNIIHKDLCPDNILINKESEQLKIIDFGLATKLTIKQPFLESPENIIGTLEYISPEQTGRMNRHVDYRSDLYALGAIFYKMLTAHSPFESGDPMELIHYHIAKQPVAPRSLNADIPRPLSELVLKLLSKNAEDRYQSSYGLAYDLKFIQDNWNPFEDINLTLGKQDFSGKFQLSQKLYGRDKEVNQLLEIYDRVSSGEKGHLFVAGVTGSGKSALIQEVYRSLSTTNGRFVSGKFDQYQRNLPYFAWIQALNEFTNQILAEPDKSLEEWKNRILDDLGGNGQLLIDLIPNLEHIIGPQPEVPVLIGEEAQNRFNYVFHAFIKSIASIHNPLVIFLDDLQWADLASLKLLELILSSDSIRSLFIIGAYRNNDVNIGHPLQVTLDNVESELGQVEDILIENLNEDDVQNLVADTLNNPKTYRTLGTIVFRKTQGNAFYVRSFLRSLYQDGLLYFDVELREWVWDEKSVKALGLSENVGQFIAGTVNKLPEGTKHILKLASCIGNVFKVEDLLVISNTEIYSLQQTINNALEEEVIIPMRNQTYRFAHDQILQAVYALIPELERNKVHLDIGRLLLKNIPVQSRESYLSIHIFDIVNQFNYGISYINEREERILLTQLNLQAGNKALNSAAYEAAFNYFETGIELLDNKSWETDYPKILALHTGIVQAASHCNFSDELTEYSGRVLENARSTLDKIPVYELKIRYYTALNKYKEAIQTGLEVLSLLGEKFPAKPGKLDVVKYLIKTRLMLVGRSISSLGDQAMMTNSKKKSINSLIVSMGTASMFGKPALLPLFAMRVVQLAIKYGNTPEIPRGYAGMAMILCGGVGDIKAGAEFGKLSLKVGDSLKHSTTRVSAIQIYNTCIQHYTEHARHSLEPLKQAYVLGLESGDMETADFSLANYYFQRYFIGDNLEVFENDFKEACSIIEKHNQTQVHNLSVIYYETVRNLIDDRKEPWKLIGELYDERVRLPMHLEEEDATALFLFYYHKLTLAYLFQEYHKALEFAVLARKYIDGGISLMPSILFWCFDSLIRLALVLDNDGDQSRQHSGVVRNNQKKLIRFARFAPDNYQHLYDLVEAERANMSGKKERARTYYDLAISGAHKANYKNFEAISNELAGRFHLKIGNDILAGYYLEHAHRNYHQWGAQSKVKYFSSRYRVSIPRLTTISDGSSVGEGGQTSQFDNLDLTSVLNASQTIAREVSINEVLGDIMKVIIQNAGAEKGLLILKGDDRWYLECESSLDEIDHPKTLMSIPIESKGGNSSSPLLSLSIFDYVIRTKKSLVLEDASNSGNFANSKYVKTNKPKSVLCYPLLKQGKLIGCFYLENNLVIGAFTPDRLKVLELLSSQIAISIENARLYENLEEKVRDRTNALVIEKEKTEKAYRNIKMLSLIGQQINSTLSISKIIDTVYENIKEIMDAETFAVGIYESLNQSIVYRHAMQNRQKIDEVCVPVVEDRSLTSWCYLNGEEIFISDMQEVHDTRFSDLTFEIGEEARSVIFLPLVNKEEVNGIITVQSRNVDAYTQLHLDLLKNLATYVSTAIAHAREFERSEQLLLNILPQATARELKEKGKASSRSYEMASILFTDFKGFTKMAEDMSPEEVVENLDYCFRAFDRIAVKFGLEKIKTIGDSYMCAGGIPTPNESNPVDTVKAAIEMLEFMKEWKRKKLAEGLPTWEIRLGINTGKVVAGVVGQDKFAYDIWGDAVNTASRMETSGESGKINISGATYEHVKDNFKCTYRGKIEVKNKGEVDMYFVEGLA